MIIMIQIIQIEKKIQVNHDLKNLIVILKYIYGLIKEEKDKKVDNNYYDKLRYIFFKEIKKKSNINYRSSIFEKLLEENQIIKKSNEIFQFLLKSIFSKFENANNYLLNGIEEKTKQITKLIIYIYKILYNNYSINIFINEKSIDKYTLNDYKDFDSLIKKDELINTYKIDCEVKASRNDEYDDSYKKFDKYKNDQLKKKLTNRDYDIEDIAINNFYAASYNLILSDLKNESYS